MCFGKPNDLKKKKNHYIQLLVNGETAEWRLHLLVHYSSVTFCNTKPENIDTEHKIVAICWHITCNFFPKKLFKKKNKKKKKHFNTREAEISSGILTKESLPFFLLSRNICNFHTFVIQWLQVNYFSTNFLYSDLKSFLSALLPLYKTAFQSCSVQCISLSLVMAKHQMFRLHTFQYKEIC